MHPVATTTLVTLLALTAARDALAQEAPAGFQAPTARAVERTGRIAIDGRLDEDAWRRATPVTQFRQFRPVEDADPTLATEVRFLFDDEALYVGARMADPEAARDLRAPLARRDQLLAADGNNGSFNSLTTDKLAIALDPYHNHLDEALFEINPAGVRGDQFNGDASWDPVWEAAVQVDSAGWTAELRIPYSQLRFRRDPVQLWGLQIRRFADRLNELDTWAFRRRTEPGGPAYFGHLEGIVIHDSPRQVELLPYAVSRGRFRYVDPAHPYRDSRELGANVGADVKVLLTSNLTLDATVNPDFGQVEVDPATLNLSAYETFYDEKRPFFVANRGAFSFGGSRCMFCNNFSTPSAFYSRRIGRPPQLNGLVTNTSLYADVPDDATILAAAKITGRTASGYSVGLMNAVAGAERARFMTSAVSPERTQVVEPLTNYFVGRVKKELRGGATTVGVIGTSALRRLDGDSLLVRRLRSSATAAGVDWVHAWGNRVYSWRGSILATDVRGSKEAIALTQQSSARYFQRPDRRVTSDGIFPARYDPAATSLQGYAFYTRLGKDNGNWLWELAQSWGSPGYEANDIAFQSRADYKWMNGNLGRSWTTPTRWYRSLFSSVGGQQQFNYDGLRTNLQSYEYFGLEFLNYWNFRSFHIRQYTTDDDRLTRGGPVVRQPGYDFLHLQVSTDPRARAVFDVQVRGVHGFDGTTSRSFRPGLALKPAPNVFVQMWPGIDRSENSAQYVTAVGDATASAFSGVRYVFAHVTTRIASFETRVNWTMSPNLTLQVYAQPFFASGDYEGFREFASPRTARKVEYGRDLGTIGYDPATRRYTVDPDAAGATNGPAPAFSFTNPDFTSRSLRGTTVLRWEYRPGSTLFFVWTQQRAGQTGEPLLALERDARSLLSDRPDNVFLVKATYWVGR